MAALGETELDELGSDPLRSTQDHADFDECVRDMKTVWGELQFDTDAADMLSDLKSGVSRFRRAGSVSVLSTGVLARARSGEWSASDALAEHTLQVLVTRRLSDSVYACTVSDGVTSVIMLTCGSVGIRGAVHSVGDGVRGERSVPMIARVSFTSRLLGAFVTYVAPHPSRAPANVQLDHLCRQLELQLLLC
jgi:hypothetical protein